MEHATTVTGSAVRLLTKADAIGTDADIADALGTDRIASLRQVHGGTCVVVDGPSLREHEADAMLTAVPGLTLTIRSADCQTFALVTEDAGVSGVIHAGWRGLLANVIPATFALLRERFGVAETAMHIIAGPSLCLRCAEFTDPHAELPGIDPRFFHGRCVDLQGIAQAQLTTCGVSPAHISRMPGCPRCQPDVYWSYRGGDRDAVRAGKCNVLSCTFR